MTHLPASTAIQSLYVFRSKFQFMFLRLKTACQSDVSHCQARCFPSPFLNDSILEISCGVLLTCPSGICQVDFACARRPHASGWRLGTAATSSSLDLHAVHRLSTKEKLHSKSHSGAPLLGAPTFKTRRHRTSGLRVQVFFQCTCGQAKLV